MSYKNRFYIFLLAFILMPVWSMAYTTDDLFKGALSYYQQQNYPEAIRYLKLVVQSDPSNWQAYQILGNCYHQTRDDGNALAAYDKSLQANPNNPGLKKYTDDLRATNPVPPVDPEAKAKKMVREYYDGQSMQEHARTELSQYGMDHSLSREEHNIVTYGTATCARDDRRFQLGLNVLGPSLFGVDVGLSLEPTMNLGLTGVYLPGGSSEYYYALEPRLKFYSSPKDCTFFFGVGVVFADVNDSGNTNTSWIAPNFKFGLSLMDSAGLYFELEWAVGVILANATTTTTTYSYATQTYSSSSTNQGTFAGGMIPGIRIGLGL